VIGLRSAAGREGDYPPLQSKKMQALSQRETKGKLLFLHKNTLFNCKL
jgi:hypothetical protein